MDIDLLLAMNLRLQQHVNGVNPAELYGDQRAAYVRDMILALDNELHAEMLSAMGWKPWATSRHFSRDEYLHEAIDALFFLCKLILVANPQAGEVERIFREKFNRNWERYAKEYDGVAGKCPGCGRDLSDLKAIDATYTSVTLTSGLTYCSSKCAIQGSPS